MKKHLGDETPWNVSSLNIFQEFRFTRQMKVPGSSTLYKNLNHQRKCHETPLKDIWTIELFISRAWRKWSETALDTLLRNLKN